MRFRLWSTCVPLGAALIIATACAATRAPVTVAGECADAYGGQVCTWATLERNGGRMVEFGATVPIATIEGAPAEGEMHWPPHATASIPLPQEARAAGFDHLKLYWEHHGHPPGPYLVPHFDFHFYTISPAATREIDCADARKPAAIPAGYALPDVEIPGLGSLVGLCVPEMGMHALLNRELQADAPFRGTMVLGYYGGRFVFVEPMITRAMLLERRSFTLDVPALPAPIPGVRYPTAFRADYDERARAYRFRFQVRQE